MGPTAAETCLVTGEVRERAEVEAWGRRLQCGFARARMHACLSVLGLVLAPPAIHATDTHAAGSGTTRRDRGTGRIYGAWDARHLRGLGRHGGGAGGPTQTPRSARLPGWLAMHEGSAEGSIARRRGVVVW